MAIDPASIIASLAKLDVQRGLNRLGIVVGMGFGITVVLTNLYDPEEGSLRGMGQGVVAGIGIWLLLRAVGWALAGFQRDDSSSN